jgi:hypothetical protein
MLMHADPFGIDPHRVCRNYLCANTTTKKSTPYIDIIIDITIT